MKEVVFDEAFALCVLNFDVEHSISSGVLIIHWDCEREKKKIVELFQDEGIGVGKVLVNK